MPVLCDFACSHSRISNRLANKLQTKSCPTKLNVHATNSQQSIDKETVKPKLTPNASGGSCSCSIFSVKPLVRDNLQIGKKFINVDKLKSKYSHLERTFLGEDGYAEIETILGQDVFHFIRPWSTSNTTVRILQLPFVYHYIWY